MNSRRKGKEGELSLARKLREYGYDCRRGQQYSGANGDADVVGLPGIHIECKRVERLNLTDAMHQAMRDTRAGELPAVFHRPTRAYTALKRWGCDTLLDVADLYPNEIRKVRFLGEKTIAEITRKLSVMGIHFDDSGDCTGCRWKDRPQKCNCCRRNQNLKDCYEEAQK